jgi:hypothetical protein
MKDSLFLFVLLSAGEAGDIMKIREPGILRTRCLMTVIGVEIVCNTGELEMR